MLRNITITSGKIFLLKILNICFKFVIAWILVRILGVEGYGQYTLIITMVMVMQIISVFGLDILLVKNISIYKDRNDDGHIRGIIHFAHTFVLVCSAVVILTGIIVSILVDHSLARLFLLGLPAVIFFLPVSSLMQINQAIIRGLKKIVLSQISENFIVPFTLAIIISTAYFVYDAHVTLLNVLLMFLVATFVGLAFNLMVVRRSLKDTIKKENKSYDLNKWFQSATPLFLITGMAYAQKYVDILMLGSLADAVSVGIFAITSQITMVINFFYVAYLTTIEPTVASLYAKGATEVLQKLIQRGILIVTAVVVPAALILGIYSIFFLTLFGPEFVAGVTALRIILIGRVFNIISGPVALLMNMTGHERVTAIFFVITLVLKIILNLMLIPLWGINGAAISTVIGIVFWNSALLIYVWRVLRINTTIFPYLLAKH